LEKKGRFFPERESVLKPKTEKKILSALAT